MRLDECGALWGGLIAWVASINSVHWRSVALSKANNVSNRVLLEGTVAMLRRLVIMLVWCAECGTQADWATEKDREDCLQQICRR